MAHYAIQDGQLETFDSTPETGPEVEIIDKDGKGLLVSVQQRVPEMNIDVGERAWYTTDEVVVVDDSRIVCKFKDKKLNSY